jgi:glycerate kinase
VVGVGGSATTDGGAGLVSALGARLLDASGAALPPGGGSLVRLARVDLAGLDPRLRACRIEVAVDVRSPLLGPLGAAAVFAPQKGASPVDVVALEHGLARWVEVLAESWGVDPARADEPGMGAAGGCAFGLAAVCGALIVPGAALVCDLVGLDAALARADLVLTGEGRLDATTAEGKAPAEVARRAATARLPCVALAGSVAGPTETYAEAVAIGHGLPLDVSMARSAELLRATAADAVRRVSGALDRPAG